jgi:hypothetical protein
VKLRGRLTTPNQSRGRTISSRARGDTTVVHGPLQRLLDFRTIQSIEFLSWISTFGSDVSFPGHSASRAALTSCANAVQVSRFL